MRQRNAEQSRRLEINRHVKARRLLDRHVGRLRAPCYPVDIARDVVRPQGRTPGRCRLLAVRPEGANHQWRKNPPRELSIDLVADERLPPGTAKACASWHTVA